MKQVGVVSAKQFGYCYIGGIPYSPKKVSRFMSKGLGIKIQDIVLFDFDIVDGERVLNFIKNAVYAEEDEKTMVKEFVRASELARENIGKDVSDEMKKELAEEGTVITNDTVLFAQNPDQVKEIKSIFDQTETEEAHYDMDIDPEILKLLTADERRTMSIYLQSSYKAALDRGVHTDCTWDEKQLFEDALEIALWIDHNSTQIIDRAKNYLAAKNEKTKWKCAICGEVSELPHPHKLEDVKK